MARRRFTLKEAESLLPRLSQLMLQMQERKDEHDRLEARVDDSQRKMAGNGHLIEKELNEARQELAQAAAQVNGFIEKVQELGCELKDIDQGLVDFPTVLEGRDIYLCWKLGEPSIAWWHELDTGFAGRQPLERL